MKPAPGRAGAWRCLAAAAVGALAAGAAPTGAAAPGASPLGSPAVDPAVARFVDETTPAGVFSRFDGDWEYMVGGGVAAFDCDGDQVPELLLSGGVNKARLLRNRSRPGGPLRFQEQRSGLELTSVVGTYPLDIDGDGQVDLVLLRVGEVVLMRGLGDCRFERANEAWGFDGGNQWNTAFSATWLPGERWPTLAIGTYIDRTRQDEPWGSCTPNRLYRPAEPAGFRPPQGLSPGHCALSMLFSDWARSGRQELRISNDREYYKGGQEQLWQVSAHAPPRAYGPADGWAPLQIWGMGIASAVLDGSPHPAYFLTSMADNKLQVLQPPEGGGAAPRPRYQDAAFARGATAHRPYAGGDVRPSTAWHAQFEDVNHDGWTDLFIVKGNVGAMPEFAQVDPNNLLLQRPDGRFVESGQAAGIAGGRRGRGGLLVDLNSDGWLDMVVVNLRDQAQLWRNLGTGATGAHWLKLRLSQPGGNRDAIGAWVELRTGERLQQREITAGGGHASGQLGWLHLGLGPAERAALRVRWPDGALSDWFEVAADQHLLLPRDQAPQPWKPQ